MRAIETERRSLSLELHEDFAQVLSVLKMTVQTMVGCASTPEYEKAVALVQHLVEHTRSISMDLRPTVLDDLGLFPALKWYVNHFTNQTNIQVRFICPDTEQRLASQAEIIAYRIVQEALMNVAQHAQVVEVTVRLWYDAQRLHLQIVDEGKGFDLHRVKASVTSSGLFGMQERAAFVGGELEIETALEGGTCITIKVPLT